MRSGIDLCIFRMDGVLLEPAELSTGYTWQDMYNEATLCKETDLSHADYSRIPDFTLWMQKFAKFYQGKSARELQDRVLDIAKLRSGAMDFVSYLRKKNPKMRAGIIAKGNSFIASYLNAKLELDFFYANELEESEGVFTGNTIIHVDDKVRVANTERKKGKTIEWANTMYVGCSVDDIPLWQKVGHAYAIGTQVDFRKYASQHATFRFS